VSELPGWAVALVVVALVYVAVVVILVVAGHVLLARELAVLVPNLVRLFAGLLRDRRVPLYAKAVLAIAALWLASPIDLIPDFIPIAGQLDDVIVAAVALRIVVGAAGVDVVREHWRGDPPTLERLMRWLRVARRDGTPPALP
jgi:uncharacterized membrane protein YkvA (DUF1232 family)